MVNDKYENDIDTSDEQGYRHSHPVQFRNGLVVESGPVLFERVCLLEIRPLIRSAQRSTDARHPMPLKWMVPKQVKKEVEVVIQQCPAT